MIRSMWRDRTLVGIVMMGAAVDLLWTCFIVATDRPLDYYAYVIAAHAFGNGIDIYKASEDVYNRTAHELGIVDYALLYMYPILTALVVYPLTFLKLHVGAALWVGLNGLATLASGLILSTFTAEKWKRYVLVLLPIIFVPILTTMHAGQVNGLVLLSVVLTFHFFRTGKELSGGGIALSLGIWLKPFAIALIPLIVFHRMWRALAGLMVSSLFINLAALIYFGTEPILSQFRPIVNAATPLRLHATPTVQNLNGLLGRWAIGVPSSLSFLLYLAMAGLLLVITVIVILLHCRKERLEMEAALLVVATHLMVPLTWYHHPSMLLLVLSLILIHRNEPFVPSGTGIFLTLGFVLTDIHGLAWKKLTDFSPISTSFPTLFSLLLWILALTNLMNRQAREGMPRDVCPDHRETDRASEMNRTWEPAAQRGNRLRCPPLCR